MTRHILLFAALIAVGTPAIPAAAQSDAIVQGQVIAAADRSALPGATVTLQTAAGNLPKEATTDDNGRFVFAQVAPDQCRPDEPDQEIGVALPALRPATENQFELGGAMSSGPLQLNVTGYYRATDNPVHTTVWPDARIYSYDSFDRGRAYGLEARTDVNAFARLGLTGYMNHALGRVEFKNPVTGGFVTEAEHLSDTNWFNAPMDQLHTLTAGGTYRQQRSGFWTGLSVEYGSGTPVGHGDAHDDSADEQAHTDAADGVIASRVPGHFTADATIAVDLLRDRNRRPRLTVRFDVTNVANSLFVIARESEFSPGQHSNPRQLSISAQLRF